MAKLVALESDVIHRICTNQVIVDLGGAIKELVENSVDAGATRVDVRLIGKGADLISVSDNGTGISRDNYASVASRHATSKIQNFDQIRDSLDTFGFRGEALSSLCAMSEFSITTRTKEDTTGTTVYYDKMGGLEREESTAREVGTTVTVKDLFKNVPIRHKEFINTIKNHLAQALRLIQQFAIRQYKVRFHVVSEKGTNRTTLFSTTGTHDSLLDCAKSVLGFSVGTVNNVDIPVQFGRIHGFISAAGGGRWKKDLQFFYVNGRPAEAPKKIAKVINDIYREFNSKSYPVYVLNYDSVKEEVDVNVTPDKRTIFVSKENEIAEAIKDFMVNSFAGASTLLGVGEMMKNLAPLPDATGGEPENETPAQEDGAPSTEKATAKGKAKTRAATAKATQSSTPSAPKTLQDYSALGFAKIEKKSSTTSMSSEGGGVHSIFGSGSGHASDTELKPLPPSQDGESGPPPAGENINELPENGEDEEKINCTQIRSCENGRDKVEDIVEDDGMEDDGNVGQTLESSSSIPGVKLVSFGPSSTQEASEISSSIPGVKLLSFGSSSGSTDASESSSTIPGVKTISFGPNTTINTSQSSSSIPGLETISFGPSSTINVSESNSSIPGVKTISFGPNIATIDASENSSSIPGVKTISFAPWSSENASEEDRKHPISAPLGSTSTCASSGAMGSSEAASLHCCSHFHLEMDTTNASKTQDAHDEHECTSKKSSPKAFESFRVHGNSTSKGSSSSSTSTGKMGVDTSNAIEDTEGDNVEQDVVVHGGGEASMDVVEAQVPPSSEVDGRESSSGASRKRAREEEKEADKIIISLDDVKKCAKKSRCSNIIGECGQKLQHSCSGDLEALSLDAQLLPEAKMNQLNWSSSIFDEMVIHGQFNLGFIIATHGSHTFIIDQHASDEKRRFELLNRTSRIDLQPLIMPMRLELPLTHEQTVINCAKVFEANGFRLKFDMEKPPGRRVSVTSLPVSDGFLFSKKDIDDLIYALEDSGYDATGDDDDEDDGGEARTMKQKESTGSKLLSIVGHRSCSFWGATNAFPRPQKVWSLLASRACRSAVMIGTPMRPKAMNDLVRSLGTLEQPWNCPHGRPTLRHLHDLSKVKRAETLGKLY